MGLQSSRHSTQCILNSTLVLEIVLSMLGVSGQSKGLSQRGAVVKKRKAKATAVGKLPAVVLPADKPANGGNKKPACKVKSGPVQQPKEGSTATANGASKRFSGADGGELPILTVENVLEIAKLQLSLQPGEHCGTVKVRFNHYNKSFPIYNGVLKWSDIDEEYCLSFVYRGNYGRELVLLPVDSTRTDGIVAARHDDSHMYYVDMRANSEYGLEVTEDPQAGIGAEGLRLNTGPLKSTELSNIQSSQKAIKSTTIAMDAITAELKSIAVTDLSGAHAKDLIERRDLEDILYSG